MEIDALPPCPIESISLRSVPDGVTPICEATIDIPAGCNTIDYVGYGTDYDIEIEPIVVGTIATKKERRQA